VKFPSDVVIQSLVSDLFWLILIVVVIASFRNEIRNLLNSLGSFKVAGASFELKDSRTTIENYVVLTNIMIEALTQRESAVKIGDLISDLSVRQLGRFAIKYAEDVPDDAKQVELLKNIALIVGRRGDADSAIVFYDAILKQRPRDLDLLNLKANALSDSTFPDYVRQAEQIEDDLVAARPMEGRYRFNRALTRARLGKFDGALEDLKVAVEMDYWKRRPDMLTLREFEPLRQNGSFEPLEAKVSERMRKDS